MEQHHFTKRLKKNMAMIRHIFKYDWHISWILYPYNLYIQLTFLFYYNQIYRIYSVLSRKDPDMQIDKSSFQMSEQKDPKKNK